MRIENGTWIFEREDLGLDSPKLTVDDLLAEIERRINNTVEEQEYSYYMKLREEIRDLIGEMSNGE